MCEYRVSEPDSYSSVVKVNQGAVAARIFKALSQRVSIKPREPKVVTCEKWTEKDTRDAFDANPPPSDGKIAEAVQHAVVQAPVKPQQATFEKWADDESCDVADSRNNSKRQRRDCKVPNVR
ncbi:hypothetical protein HBI24_246430 [Parastagonospora nodorum]|nr:hypothetical protein HBI24_246430 [Parastagonospora nodorum]